MPERIRLLRLVLIAGMVVGIALRTIQFRQIPPGLYRDEAYTGMDGQRTLDSGPRMFYDSSFGREPLFTWLVALSVRVWGASPLATRFPSLVVGILTLLTCYWMVRELFDQRVGVLATAVLAITLWHVHFSRVSFRAIMDPFLSSIAVWQAARGARTGRRLPWVLGGIAAGALIYTYISVRTAILPVSLLVLYVWWRRRSFRMPNLRDWLLFAISAAMVMMPFIIYGILHWDQVFLRTQNVESVFNKPEPLKMLLNNIAGALGMFILRGDFQYRHNVPLRPVFDPALGAMFLLGLWLSVRRFKRDYAAAFLLMWTATMLLPTILTKDSPHFIRAMDILPFVTIFPALGLDWTWNKLGEIRSERWALSVVFLVLLIGLGSTIWAYFIRYPSFPETCYWFECAGVEMASEINGYLETGWTKDAWFVRDQPGRTDRQVFVQFQLWKDVVNAHFLIPDSPGFNVPGEGFVTSVPPRPDLPMIFYGWYNQHYPEFWKSDLLAWLPPNAMIEMYEGPWATTHQDRAPHPAYLKFVATPTQLPDVLLAELNQGISLVSSCTLQHDGQVTLHLIWYNQETIAADYTVFVHYERDGQIIAQADGPPAMGYYPTSNWRPYDQFLDQRSLQVPEILDNDRIWVGMYLWQTGERLPVLAASTMTQDDRIEVDLQLCEG